MGTIKKGIMGGFSGKVGNVVGASWKGIDYIRSLPSKVRNPKTPGQVMQRDKFSLIVKFVRSVLPVIQVGFKSSAGAENSAYTAAMSYNMNRAVKGEYPDFEIDFPNAAISRGSLPAVNNLTAEREAGSLNFAWDTDAFNNASALDRVMLIAYNPGKQQAVYNMSAGARGEGNAPLAVPSAWDGDDVEAFAVFISEDGTGVSDSVYAGRHEAVEG